jgi:hypothetical protein
MLQLFKHQNGRSQMYMPSTQTHCRPTDVECWIEAAADSSGHIRSVHIELYGAAVRVAHVDEARIIAELYAADHNDYVTRNLCYALEPPENTQASEGVTSDVDAASVSADELEERLQKLEFEFELNEELTVGEFGPSHAKDSNW